jgi:hypothetical protein
MQSVMTRIELLLIHVHAIEQVLLKKGAVTEEELLSYIQKSTSLPNTNLGMQVLKEMLQPDIGTKVLKEMLAEMQEKKGDSHGNNGSVHKS